MGGRKIERAAPIGAGTGSAKASVPRASCVSRQKAAGQRLQEEQTWQPAAPWKPWLKVLQRSIIPMSSPDVSESTMDMEVLPVGSRQPSMAIPAIPCSGRPNREITSINLVAANRTIESNLSVLELFDIECCISFPVPWRLGRWHSAPLSLPRSSLPSVTRRAFAWIRLLALGLAIGHEPINHQGSPQRDGRQ